MNLLPKYLNRLDFADYADYKANLKLLIPEKFNFGFDIVDEYARLTPDKRALVWCDDKGDERVITFGELSKLSNRMVNLLISYGVKKGDYVMSMLNRRYEYWILTVACFKMGAVIVPATHLLTAKDVEYRCHNGDVKLLFATAETDVIEHISEALPKCGTVKGVLYTKPVPGFPVITDELNKFSQKLPPKLPRPENDDIVLMYFTSGTTGMPKMVMHNNTYPLCFISNAYFWQCVVDDGLHFTMAETGWAKSSWGKIFGQWIAGSAVFAYDYHGRFTPTDVLPLIEKYRITTFCAPPTIYRFLVKEDLSKFNFSSLSHCTTAGEALNAEIFKQFKDATGLKIYEGFGQTETAVILGNYIYDEPISGSLGKPSAFYDVALVNDDDEVVQDGTEGEIVILNKSDLCGLVCGYKNEPDRTFDARGGKYYHTGDLALRDKNGVYWFVGRKDDIIKSSGYRIGPFEVESVLVEHPAVLECAITGAPDPVRGQVVKASIVLAKGYTPSDALKKELQEHVKKNTAPYKYPRIIEFCDTLPKTVSGKIKRVDIRKESK